MCLVSAAPGGAHPVYVPAVPPDVLEARPLGADRRAELLELVMLVGSDRGDPGVGHGDLRIERGELEVLLVLVQPVAAALQRPDQSIVAL